MIKFLLLLVFLGIAGLIGYAISLRKVVATNEVHIVQSKNKTVVYGKNTKTGNVYREIPPWVPGFGVIVTQLPSTILNISFSDFVVRDNNMIPFVVGVRAYVVIEDYILAATRIFTINELKEHLTGVLQTIVRKTFGQKSLIDILKERNDFGSIFTEACKEEFKLWGTAPLGTIEIVSLGDYKDYKILQEIETRKIEEFLKKSK